MKRLFMLLIVMLFGFVLVGCSSESEKINIEEGIITNEMQKEDTKEKDKQLLNDNDELPVSSIEPISIDKIIDLSEINKIQLSMLFWSANKNITNVDEIKSFLSLFLENTYYTDANAEINYAYEKIYHDTLYNLSIFLFDNNGNSITITVNEEGDSILHVNSNKYVPIFPKKMDYNLLRNY